MQANENISEQENELSGQFLSFHLSGEDYGVDILRVQEIRGWESVRALPDAPDYVKGVLDLRGIIVPIIDLRMRFGNKEPEYSPTTVVIVTAINNGEGEHQLVGAVVDGVSDVLDISAAEMKPPPAIAGAISQHYLHGMVTLDRGMVVLIDIDKLLSQKELTQLGEMAA